MSSQIQTNFTSGALDPSLKSRIDVKHYYNGAEVMRNVTISPQGGFSMRDGSEYLDEVLPQVELRAVTATAPGGLSVGVPADAADDDRTTTVTTLNAIGVLNPYTPIKLDYGPMLAAFVTIHDISLTVGTSTEFRVEFSLNDVDWFLWANIPLVDTTPRDYLFRSPGWPLLHSARYWRLVRVGATDLGAALVNLGDMLVFRGIGVSPVKMIPFQFSLDDTYMMVVTDRAMCVYRDGVFQVGIPMVYPWGAIRTLNWTQSFDTLLMVQEHAAPQLIQRQGSDTVWKVSDQAFLHIPLHNFEPVTSNPASTVTPDVADGSGMLTSAAPIFLASHIDQIIEGNGARIRIVSFVDTRNVHYVTIFPFFDLHAMATGEWTLIEGYEASWSDTRGWPRSATFHEARLVIGGSRDLPEHIWMSRVGFFFDFQVGTFIDDDAIDVAIQRDDRVIIHNVVSGNNLQIFAAGSEFFIPQSEEQPITPATVSIKQTTTRGSQFGIRTAAIGGETYFVQRQGRAVREYIFSEVARGYTSDNISLLAAHLIKTPIAMASRTTTSTNQADLVLVVNTDGTLAILTRLIDQELVAWVAADTAGSFVHAGVDVDDIYIVSARTIEGISKQFLERFTAALLTDAGKVQTITGTTVSNLEHLEGRQVKVVVNSGLHADETVSGGEIELDNAVVDGVVEVGLGYTWEVTDMPVVQELQDGTRMDGKKRVIEQIIELIDTKDIIIDGERPAFRTFGTGDASPLDATIVPFTGRKRLEGRLGYDDLAQTTMSGDNPLAATVLSLEKRIV